MVAVGAAMGDAMSNVEEFRFRCANAAGCLTS
jgi:hypothetical protein